MGPSVMMVERELLSLVGINYELPMPWHGKQGGPHGGFFVKVVVKSRVEASSLRQNLPNPTWNLHSQEASKKLVN